VQWLNSHVARTEFAQEIWQPAHNYRYQMPVCRRETSRKSYMFISAIFM
jgi:hypothetical protein